MKSTPFQAVFSEKTIKSRETKKGKLKELQLYINDELVDVPIRIDISNGRVQFKKVRILAFRDTLKGKIYLIILMSRMMIAHSAQTQEKKEYRIL